MGLLSDIRSGKRNHFGLGVYAVIFWFVAGLAVGGGTGAYVAGGSEKALMIFGFAGVATGLCIGFYAAFGDTKFAKALALPGMLFAMLEFLV